MIFNQNNIFHNLNLLDNTNNKPNTQHHQTSENINGQIDLLLFLLKSNERFPTFLNFGWRNHTLYIIPCSCTSWSTVNHSNSHHSIKKSGLISWNVYLKYISIVIGEINQSFWRIWFWCWKYSFEEENLRSDFV